MSSWRDELVEAIKSQAEREAEEEARRKKRLEEALAVADEAIQQASEGLEFAHEQLKGKKQPATLDKRDNGVALSMHEQKLSVSLSRDTAVVEVSCNDGKPREFDFAKDRHLAPKDVEEYVGRRVVELARTAQKQNPW